MDRAPLRGERSSRNFLQGDGLESRIIGASTTVGTHFTELSMNKHLRGRREFLKSVTALGAAGLPAMVPGLRPHMYSAAAVTGSAAKATYNPAGKFEIKVSEVEVRRNKAGRMLMARVYQPVGAGPFPTVLDLHGGAWNGKDRTAEEPMDRALAGSGVLVVAIDLTLAPEAPYPASVQDANYG